MRFVCIAAVIALPLGPYGCALAFSLGTSSMFAVFAGSTVTNTGSSMLDGSLGGSPGTAITGFAPGSFTGTQYAGSAVAAQAQIDLAAAYNTAAAEPRGQLEQSKLRRDDATVRVYCFDSSAQLTGSLTLNTEGEQDPLFVFQIGSTPTTASNSVISFINDSGQGDDNVF